MMLTTPAPNPLTVIRQKLALGLKLKGRETRILEQHLTATQMKKRESLHHDGEKLVFKRSIDAEPMFGAIQANGELVNPRRDKSGRLYLGSIDPITAANWARECGHAIGTKPFAEYAKKKLMSNEFARFKAPVERKVFGR